MVTAIAAKTNRRRFETFHPLFAVILTIDGKRQVVSEVTDRESAQENARDINRDSKFSGFRARVRRVAVRVIE